MINTLITKRNLFLFGLFTFMIFSCDKADKHLFVLLNSDRTKVDFRNDLKESKDFNILNYIYYYNGGGVSIGDINEDGLPDLFFTSNEGSNRLYLNKGGLTFEDISQSAGISGSHQWSTGTSMVDLNGDGLLDIYVCNLGGGYEGMTGRNELFINQGNNTFIESGKEYGLDFSGYATQATFFDYDNDDDLDVFLLNHSVHTDRTHGNRKKLLANSDSFSGDRLFRNDSFGSTVKFKDVTNTAEINSSIIGYGLGVSTADVNNDGFIDIYVSNDFHENDYLYINNGNGTFTESSQKMMEHTSHYSMGNDIADFNNDGFVDIVTVDMLPEDISIFQRSVVEDSYDFIRIKRSFGYGNQLVRNTLQLNMKDGNFVDIAPLAGIEATDWSWSPLLSDFDNDGYKDLFVTNGIYRRPNDLDYLNYYSNEAIQRSIANGINANNLSIIEKMPINKIPNNIFKNNGKLQFINQTNEWGFDKSFFSNGASYSDLDGDGDLEIVTNNINDFASIYENRSDAAINKFIKVKLKGSGKNKFGIGAKIIIESNKGTIFSEQSTTRGFQSSVDPMMTIGIGEGMEKINSMIVIWPGGSYQTLKNVKLNTTIELKKVDAKGDYYNERISKEIDPLFSICSDSLILDYKHRENIFFDKNRENLIPHPISREGPKLALADINYDGREDIFIGGAKGIPATLFLQDKTGKWIYSKQNAIENDSLAEDGKSIFIDLDNDNYLDLYVCSGGNEYWGDNEWLKDRIYKNDGKGNFTKFDLAFTGNNVNTSSVAFGDYDNDGDIDLFIGGRSESWKYGISPKSYLLENDGKGQFENITKSRAPELEEIGMVTDAIWADIDSDGSLELLVVGEWMPITIFENRDGKMVNITDEINLTNSNGLWNTISQGDFDNDGDLDFIVGNYGLNSKLKPSQYQAVELYVKDFDDNGKTDPIVAIPKNGNLYPLATLNELIDQIPNLKKKFPNYVDFSGQSIKDIFDASELKDAVKKEINILETVLLENLGNKSFDIRKLPIEVQFAPIYAIASSDFDGDGNLDLLLGGNSYGINPNLGRQDASRGWFLKGGGDGSFETRYPFETGFASDGLIRDIKKVVNASTEKPQLIIARNNDYLQIFNIISSKID